MVQTSASRDADGSHLGTRDLHYVNRGLGRSVPLGCLERILITLIILPMFTDVARARRCAADATVIFRYDISGETSKLFPTGKVLHRGRLKSRTTTR